MFTSADGNVFENQGINIILSDDEHCIGRLVPDTRYQIDSNSVSAKHCTIYRKSTEDGSSPSVFLKDTRLSIAKCLWLFMYFCAHITNVIPHKT